MKLDAALFPECLTSKPLERLSEKKSFKTKTGEVTNAIPDYNDMKTMETIVNNAGKKESVNMMEMATPSPVSQNNNKAANNNAKENH